MTIENNVIITGYKNPTSEGIILCLNKSTSLKTGNVRGTEFWVSWDKIGKELFDGYTNLSDVAELDKLRKGDE
jgi:hypothetical protein